MSEHPPEAIQAASDRRFKKLFLKVNSDQQMKVKMNYLQ